MSSISRDFCNRASQPDHRRIHKIALQGLYRLMDSALKMSKRMELIKMAYHTIVNDDFTVVLMSSIIRQGGSAKSSSISLAQMYPLVGAKSFDADYP